MSVDAGYTIFSLIFSICVCGKAFWGGGRLMSWNLGPRYKICSEMISCFSCVLCVRTWCRGDVATLCATQCGALLGGR